MRDKTYTNTVEGFFGLLKGGINGRFHHVNEGHFGRYYDEFAFRYSAREMSDASGADLLAKERRGKCLTYA